MTSGTSTTPRVGASGTTTSIAVPLGNVCLTKLAIQDRRLGQAGEPFLDGSGPDAADALDVVQFVDGGPQQLLQVAEPLNEVWQ